MEEGVVKEKVVGESIKLKYILQRTLLVLVIVIALLIVFILVFLFIRNFVMVPSQLMAVSFAIDESSVSLNDLTGELNFVARKIEGVGTITDLVFIFFDKDGGIASIRQNVSFDEDFEKEIVVDYSDFGLGKIQEVSIVPVLVLEEEEVFGSEINIIISVSGYISVAVPSPVTDSCGDGTCSGDETSETCPTDCPVTDSCGDGTCSGDETSETCPTDCTASAVCGDADDVCSEGSIDYSCEVGDGYIGTTDCSADCSAWETCVPTEWCGEETINGNEVCDGSDLNEQTCQSQGYQFGDLACGTNCLSYDVSDCSNSHPIFGDPLVEDGNPLSTGPFLRTWPFDDVSELELPEGTECTPGYTQGNLTDHECIDPYYIAERPHWYVLGNSDTGASNPYISTAPGGTIAAHLENIRTGYNTQDLHARVVVPLSRPNPPVYYVGFDFYWVACSFTYRGEPNDCLIPGEFIEQKHVFFSMRNEELPDEFAAPSNQQDARIEFRYQEIDEHISLDTWERMIVKHNVSGGIVDLIYNGEIIESVEGYIKWDLTIGGYYPGEEAHQIHIRSRCGGPGTDCNSYGTIWYNNLAVGTDYDDVLDYQG